MSTCVVLRGGTRCGSLTMAVRRPPRMTTQVPKWYHVDLKNDRLHRAWWYQHTVTIPQLALERAIGCRHTAKFRTRLPSRMASTCARIPRMDAVGPSSAVSPPNHPPPQSCLRPIRVTASRTSLPVLTTCPRGPYRRPVGWRSTTASAFSDAVPTLVETARIATLHQMTAHIRTE